MFCLIKIQSLLVVEIIIARNKTESHNLVAGDDSRMAANVFGSAVEFLTTAAEFEIPQYKASLVLLPNILSPGKLRKDP